MFHSVQADLYNFADDNNLSTVSNTIDEAKAILITETEAAINWIKSKQMIANSENLLGVLFCKQIVLNKSTNYKYQGDLIKK